MKTEQLIDFLARDVEPARRPSMLRAMLAALIGGLLIAIVLIVTAIGMRPDIGTAIAPVLLKAGFGAAFVAAALPVMLRLAKPGRPLGWRAGALAGFVAIAFLVAGIALFDAEPQNRMRAWTGDGFPWCLVLVPVLAAPTAAGLIWLVRGLAPTSLARAGAAIGAVAGGVGAMAYAMYCPVDSIAFVVTWYSVAIALCAALGAIFASRFLRW